MVLHLSRREQVMPHSQLQTIKYDCRFSRLYTLSKLSITSKIPDSSDSNVHLQLVLYSLRQITTNSFRMLVFSIVTGECVGRNSLPSIQTSFQTFFSLFAGDSRKLRLINLATRDKIISAWSLKNCIEHLNL